MKNVASFMDFELDTKEGAFFPRPETELLVEKACELLSQNKASYSNILDIGTGSGNIAISLTKYIPSSKIVALDISQTALRTAKKNAAKYKLTEKISFIKSDLFKGLDKSYWDSFDLVISNPPYISLKDFITLPKEVKDDPYIALYGGKDGLTFYREIIEKAPLYMKKDSFLLFEIGYDQKEHVKNMLEQNSNFCDINIYKDYSGIDRIVSAKKWTS